MTTIIPPRPLERDHAPNRIGQLVIIFILILIFVVIAARSIWELRIVAEQTSVMHTVGALHSAIGIQVMERVVKSGLDAVATMEHANPMDYLDPERMPGNYQKLEGPVPPEQLAPRRWYYEPQEGILIYRVEAGDYLETELPGPPRIRFQLQLRYDDANGNGRYDAGIDSLGGVGMVALEPYRWLAP
jgi:general secretion pathway protein G